MIPNVEPVAASALLAEVQKRFDQGLRLVTLTAVENKQDATFDIFYHFDKDLSASHLKLTVPLDAAVPSVSGIYFLALLPENEIKDQFGVNFQNIVIDFGCTLYLEADVVKSPFCTFTYTRKGKEA